MQKSKDIKFYLLLKPLAFASGFYAIIVILISVKGEVDHQ